MPPPVPPNVYAGRTMTGNPIWLTNFCTKLSAIQQAEDRDLFRTLMNELNEPVPESEIIHSLEEAEKFVSQIGFPVIVRPAYTLLLQGSG